MKNLKLWNSYYYKVNDSIITKDLVKESVNSFWKEITKIVECDQHIISLFRIKTEDNVVLTLGQLKKLNIEDKEYYNKYILDVISLKSEDYSFYCINEIIFSYGTTRGR